jgi:FkbM family methyltransferase
MIAALKKEVEKNRSSKNLFWRICVCLKDILWRLQEIQRTVFVFVLFGSRVRFMRNDSIRVRLAKFLRVSDEICLICDIPGRGESLIASPYACTIKAEYFAMPGYVKEYFPKAGDTVIDGGAYEGFCTVVFSMLVGESGKVIAFEPNPQNFRGLECNIKDYGLKNVIAVNKGLWSDDGQRSFIQNGPTSLFLAENDSNIERFPVVSLDNELSRIGIAQVDFIKMDIEASEIEAVIGSKKTLAGNNTHLAIASYHLLSGRQTYHDLELTLKELGYCVKSGNEKHKTTYAWKNDADNSK